MTKRWVTCIECGRQFDVNHRGGYYDRKTKRYTCKSCGKKLQADYNERTTGMRQSRGAMYAKIIFGAIFIIAGFSSPETGWTIGYFLTALVVGGGLIAWGLVPYIKAKKEAAAEAEAKAEAIQEELNTPKKCPACGATSKGKYCEYCGTHL